MWSTLKQTLELEPAVDSSTNTYLGCSQKEVKIEESLVKEKADLFRRLLTPKGGTTCEEDKSTSKQARQEGKKEVQQEK